MDWQLIESDQALAQLISSARGCDAVMIDTEFMRRNTFFPQVALAQLCFSGGGAEGTAWLLDPLQIDDPGPLVALFQDEAVVKVLHSASEDLEVFQHWLGSLPQPLFDTQKAAAMVGLDFGLGYRAMVLELCGEDLPKGETRSDWLQRPLTESQCHYAAQDVIYLLQAYSIISQRCREQGKYDWVLEDGAEAATTLASAAPDYFRRIKNAWKLKPRQLAVLMAVCDWREKTARRADKPRSWIIDDKACLQIAQLMPSSRSELQAGVELPPAVLRRRGDILVQLVDDMQHIPANELPAALPPPLDARQRDQLKGLRKRAADIAGELGVAPQTLVASKDYETLLRNGGQEPAIWRGWRKERVIEPLKQYLQGTK